MRYIILITFLSTLYACNVQHIENYNSDFEGKWETAVYNSSTTAGKAQNYIIIDGENSGLGIACTPNCELCDCTIFKSGRAKINTSNNGLQIGGTVDQIMIIEQEPFINENNEWEMVVENMRYFKYQ